MTNDPAALGVPLLPVAEAQARLFAMAPPVAPERVPLRAAAGRWAAEDILARRTQPAADLSAMDGYAIRHADLPGPWCVIGESAAGSPFSGTVAAGEATRIFTGAALPAGTDTVLIQEEAGREGERLILTGEGPGHLGRNVRRRGLDFSESQPLVRAGERLTPARIAVAATGGHGDLPVRRRLRVAIAATGDELVPPGSDPTGLSLPESNGAMLAAMLANLPVDLIDLGILPDRLDILRDAFAGVEADLLVTTGGASVGDHDLVRPAIEAAGGVIDFWRIALRPGKPMMAGQLGDAIVLGLPGNPVSAFVTATLFVLPVIAHLGGAGDPLPLVTSALLGEPLPANQGRTDYLRAELRDGRAFASTIQDSSMLLTLARSTCLIIRPAHAPAATVGESAEILVIA
ncbi:molybdenum cofactor biosynthesis protein MoeA [Sphingomonas sp. Leaf339]|uniref:molybdopterin molybdotransferase MoeA n=1 Tax=Sphingomonas sp. Leaf339 TaxID=1736343 RepID=UPI0006FFD1ED|nr:molybdopterin molybdotransferase MoeA [Sphingomonas sp. Leaf339]KQU62391.1 molybdenum cofactor biosynthesis protein MoeA [Sphingomonas sp. Leaf339]